MKVSMREFQLNAPKYLKDMPLELTRYGSIVAIVDHPEKEKRIQEISKTVKEIKNKILLSPPLEDKEKLYRDYPELRPKTIRQI